MQPKFAEMNEYEQNALISGEIVPIRRVRVKKCSRCFAVKEISDFGSNSTSSDGFQSWCKPCRNTVHVKRRKTDLAHRLMHHFHTRMSLQLSTTPGGVPKDLWTNLEGYLGYTFRELKRALDKDILEREGINLKEALVRRGYHVDHVRPIASYAIIGIGDPTFRECWAISNLRAIPSAENLAKGSKYEAPSPSDESESEEID